MSNAEPPVVSGGSEGRGLPTKAMPDRPGAGRRFRHVIGRVARPGARAVHLELTDAVSCRRRTLQQLDASDSRRQRRQHAGAPAGQ